MIAVLVLKWCNLADCYKSASQQP